MANIATMLRITFSAAYAPKDDSVRFSGMGAVLEKFRDVARWPVVMTTGSGRGHPEPRRRHRRGSKLAHLQIRVMLAELVRWRRQARRYGLTLSEYVRTTMNHAKVRVVAVADPDYLAELKRHGNNLNQLMHAVHADFPIEAARVEAVLSSLQALYLREIERG